MNNRARYITQLFEDHRQAYQVLCTPDSDGVTVRFMDDHLGNPDLKFPQIKFSKEDFFKVIPHNNLTEQTYLKALERGDSYGLLVDPRVIARLARWGHPNTSTKYQHSFNKRTETTADFNRYQTMSSRV